MDFVKRTTSIFPFYKLESESSTVSNEDTESVYSIQDRETDLARDTSDTEYQSIGSEYQLEIEYEVDTVSEGDTDSFSHSSEDSDVERDIVLAAAAAICDSSFEKWVTDGEDSDLSSSEDNSFSRTDFWTCVKCKSQNKNPLFRYCEKCFQDRKTLFPPRPRHKKPKKNKAAEATVKLDTLRSCLSGLSQDSGVGSSQECPPLGLDKIVIPQHLTETSSSSRSSDGDEHVIRSSREVAETIHAPSTSKQVTLNDIVKNISNRKRQISESSMSDNEVKRPRWRDLKKSPNRGGKSSNRGGKSQSDDSPTRKRKSTSSDRDFPSKKQKSSNDSNTKPSDKSQETIDNTSGKTSDLGSEISSGSGIFDKAEDSKDSLVESKEMCIFCNETPKNAIFLHGSIAHMCCCYKCAKKTWRTIKRCPICNRKVNNVVKVFKI
ncbi:hypothetical protein HHI36_012953 [Cryptolaemus montrouzieri]|uniref:Uncharacterized protein n=1 Tax=Cryptolaemus montrouzieri TaxID=559131 RepID=A0ABD2NFP8_9CUCU